MDKKTEIETLIKSFNDVYGVDGWWAIYPHNTWEVRIWPPA